MENKKLITRGVAEGIGLVFVLVAIRTLDKKLAAAITIRSAFVLIGSVTLATFAVNFAEQKGYFE